MCVFSKQKEVEKKAGDRPTDRQRKFKLLSDIRLQKYL